jgi:hypothetical protein
MLALAAAGAFAAERKNRAPISHDALKVKLPEAEPVTLSNGITVIALEDNRMPLAFARALELPDGEQRQRSRHHTTFIEADAGPNILTGNANWLRTRLTKNGVPPTALNARTGELTPPGMTRSARWYSSSRDSVTPGGARRGLARST